MVMLSIVIPTLRRPDTLQHALATAVAQNFEDCEIVVQNNGDDPATNDVVRRAADPRIRAFATPDVRPMFENWEIALANARGDHITFIGDDDGLMPDACAIVAHVIAATDSDIVSWLPFLYFWPQFQQSGKSNRLIAEVNSQFRTIALDARELLRQVYRWRQDYSRLPMIYNSFVSRRLIERVRSKFGRYFIGLAPDVVSGAANAAVSDRFLRLTRPLSVSGLSRHSTGHNRFVHRIGPANDPGIVQDFGQIEIDDRLCGATNLQAMIATDLLTVQKRLLADDPSVVFDVRGLLSAMARAINDVAEFYDQIREAILAIAARHGIDVARIDIPDRISTLPGLAAGVTATGQHSVRHIIDGNVAALATIQDAVRVAHRMLPALTAGDLARITIESDQQRAAFQFGDVLSFDAAGSGLPALDDGWGESEAWGTWSIASPSVLRLPLLEAASSDVWIEITCRSFIVKADDVVTITCRSGSRPLGSWRCTSSTIRRTLEIDVPARARNDDGTVVLAFDVAPMRSPAQLGVSADTRSLGIGIESLRIIAPRERLSKDSPEI